MTTKTIGDMGEHIALAHYISNGYEFVDRNYRSRYGEIDIIIKNSEYIVFAETRIQLLPKPLTDANKDVSSRQPPFILKKIPRIYSHALT